MNVPVVMPQLGLTMTEGAVAEWLKKPGDLVRKGDLLFIVSTDKADMEVESLDEGTLAQLVVEPGKTVPVGTVIAYLKREGDEAAAGSPSVEIASPPPRAEEEKPAPTISESESVSPRGEEPAASPRARRLARELGIDISTVKGSGLRGRIVEEDVRKSVESAGRAETTPELRRRQLIAEKMVQSVQTIPHFTVSIEISAHQLVLLYQNLKEPIAKSAGSKLTLTDLLLKGLGMALAETPEMNAVWHESQSRKLEGINLGLAIATDRGVVAPVIRNLDKLDLGEIVTRRSDLIDKARRGKLSLDDLEGGAGTLSNLGTYRVDSFQAIISPGQSFILAAGRIKDRPWVEGAALIIRPTARFSLSVDHRLADGAMAALFLDKIASIFENPFRILWKPKEK